MGNFQFRLVGHEVATRSCLFLGLLLASGCALDFQELSSRFASSFVVSPPVPGNLDLTWVAQLGSLTEAPSAPAGANLGADACRKIAVDNAGNIYCAGNTDGIVGETNGGGGNNDAFIAKFDTNGVILWSVQLGASTNGPNNSSNDRCSAVDVDRSTGDVYCAGTTSGAMAEANGGSTDLVLIKVNSAGTLQWVRQLGAVTHHPAGNNADDEQVHAIKVSPSGDIVVGGWTTSSFAEAAASPGGTDAFVAKFNSAGTLQWISQLGALTTAPGGDNSSDDSCYGLGFDSLGNIYCGGNTSGNTAETIAGTSDAMVWKMNSSGNFQWVTQLGQSTVAAGGNNSGSDYCYGLGVDSTDHVYCGGYTTGSMGEANGGGADPFVLKLSAAGALVWVTQMGASTVAPGGSNAGLNYFNDLTIDGSDQVVGGGVTQGNMVEVGAASIDAMVVKFNSDGVFQRARQLGSVTVAPGGDNGSSDYAFGVGTDGAQNVYIGGLTFGSIGEANAGGTQDLWVAKFTP